MTTNKSNDSENELTPLDIDMIDTKSASEGIKVTLPPYPAMRPGDVIQIYWNGYTHDHKIDDDDVNNPIEIEVPFADVKKTKKGSIPLYYRINDKAGNTSDPTE